MRRSRRGVTRRASRSPSTICGRTASTVSRSSTSRAKAALAEGQRSCFSWRFFLPAALSEERHQIGYWESYPSYKQIMSFEVRGQTIAFVTRMPSERVHWTAPGAVTPNVWHQLATCAVWSTDPARGAVDVWFDGKQVVTRGPARTLWEFAELRPDRDPARGPRRARVMFLTTRRGRGLRAVSEPSGPLSLWERGSSIASGDRAAASARSSPGAGCRCGRGRCWATDHVLP